MMRTHLILASAALAMAMLGSLPARASSCDLPDPPFCARDSGRFDDHNDFEDCRLEMGRYRARVESSIACIREEFRSTAFRFDERARR